MGELFSKYGKVGDVYIPKDYRTRENRGFGFVRYYSKRDAEEAIDGLDGRRFDGRELSVQYAKYERPDRDYRGRRRSRSRSRSRSRGRRDRSRSRSRGRRDRSRSRSDRRRSPPGPGTARRRVQSRALAIVRIPSPSLNRARGPSLARRTAAGGTPAGRTVPTAAKKIFN